MIPSLLFAAAFAREPLEAPAATAPGVAAPETEQLRAETEALRAEMEEMRAELAELRSAGRDGAGGGNTVEEDGSRTAFGEAVHVAPGEEVEEVVSFGNDVNVAGHVRGDAVSFGGNVRIAPSGRVDGDAVSFGGRVEVLDGGAVAGDRVAMGLPAIGGFTGGSVPPTPRAAVLPNAAGSVMQVTDGASDLLHALHRRIVWLLSLSGAGVLVVGLFPQRVGRVARDLEERPLRAAVVGTLASSFLLLFSLLFTLLTLGLGFPVGVLLVGILGVAWIFGFVGLCQAVGDRLPFEDRPHGRWIAFLVGVVLLTFLGSLPWVGWLVVGAASVLGIGSALSTRFGRA